MLFSNISAYTMFLELGAGDKHEIRGMIIYFNRALHELFYSVHTCATMNFFCTTVELVNKNIPPLIRSYGILYIFCIFYCTVHLWNMSMHLPLYIKTSQNFVYITVLWHSTFKKKTFKCIVMCLFTVFRI